MSTEGTLLLSDRLFCLYCLFSPAIYLLESFSISRLVGVNARLSLAADKRA